MIGKAETARDARRAAALKDNLKRRKAQARARAEPGAPAVHELGTAPQAGVEEATDEGPNAAQN